MRKCIVVGALLPLALGVTYTQRMPGRNLHLYAHCCSSGAAVGVDFGLVSLVIALNVIITASCSAAECVHCCYCWTERFVWALTEVYYIRF